MKPINYAISMICIITSLLFISPVYAKQDVIVDFGSSLGLWARMNDSNWLMLSNLSPDNIVIGDVDGNNEDDIIADFRTTLGGIYIKRNLGGWSQLHNFSSEQLAIGDLDGNGNDDIVIDFGGLGLWARMNDSSWVQLSNASPDLLLIADMDSNNSDDVVAYFSSLGGIFVKQNLGGWNQLHSSAPESMTKGDHDGDGNDDVIIDFGSNGLWARMNNSFWLKLHGTSPDQIAVARINSTGVTEDVIASFGTSVGGLWRKSYSLSITTWNPISNSAPLHFATGDMDGVNNDEVIANFNGLISGLFVYRDNSGWKKLHNSVSELLAVGDLDTDLGTFTGTWTGWWTSIGGGSARVTLTLVEGAEDPSSHFFPLTGSLTMESKVTNLAMSGQAQKIQSAGAQFSLSGDLPDGLCQVMINAAYPDYTTSQLNGPSVEYTVGGQTICQSSPNDSGTLVLTKQ